MFDACNRPSTENPNRWQDVDGTIAFPARLCIANCGTYDIRDDKVAHVLTFSFIPNLIGQTLTRLITLSGDTLTLSMPEMLVDRQKQIATLTWKRVEKLEPCFRLWEWLLGPYCCRVTPA